MMFGIYLNVISVIVFTIGFASVIVSRKSFLITIIGLETMLLAVNMSLVGFSYLWQNTIGQVLVLFVMSIGAVEIVVGLAILVVHADKTGSVFVDK